jgi:hypothetical protein
MDSLSRKLTKSIHAEFHSLISDRHLPEDLIADFVVLSESALWKHQMLGHSGVSKSKNRRDGPPPSILPGSVIEARIISHILSIHCILLQVGRDQLDEPPPPDAVESDLAQRITAVFRRTLPALRIASKWLRANFDLVLKFSEETSKSTAMRRPGGQLEVTEESFVMSEFWTTYTNFTRMLHHSFPMHRLPRVQGQLEEDVRMKGFLPLKDLLDERETTSRIDNGTSIPAAAENQVHPNVLQLMRIRDILNDAESLVRVKVSSIFFRISLIIRY